MHLRKMLIRSISLLCVLVLLLAVVPAAHAGYSGSLTNSNIGVSVSDYAGDSSGGDNANASTSASWTLNGTTITGTVTPGSRTSSSWGATTYYPFKSASTTLTLTNNSQDESLLSFECSNPSAVVITGHDKIEGNTVTATLAYGESVSVKLTTSSDPKSAGGWFSSDNRGDYTVSTELTQVLMTSLTANLNISIKSVAGGSFTGSDGTETKGEGESFSNPMDTTYSFTAGNPEENYFFGGWAFNGVKQAYTTQTITGISFKGDTVVEALYVLDPVYAITTVNGDANKDDLVSINSRYVHQTRNEFTTSGRNANDSLPYYSKTATTGTANDLDAQYVPSLQWAQSGTSVIVSASGTATGECEPSFARSWAYANMVSDVIRIYAKTDCIVKFDYKNSISGGDTNTPAVHVYESTSGTETIATVCSKGTSYTAASDTVTHTLAANRYLYIYTNGHSSKAELKSGGNGASLSYKYSATISGVEVTPNDTKYTQSTTFKDNVGNALGSGKLTVGTTTYTVDANGVASIPAMPQGQTMQMSVAAAPTNYRFIGWEVNGKMVCTQTYSYELTADTVVNPIFVPNVVTYDATTNAYQYKNISGSMVALNGQYVARNADSTVFYKSLQEGFDGSGEVVLLGNMTINGDFEIPANEILVVPCSMETVINKDSSGNYIPLANAGGSFSAYATLTMNGNMTVNGALLVSGNQAGSNGSPSGSYGQLAIPAGYTVTVNSGKSLYGYGLVNGAGRILAKSGAMIHELCEVRDIPHPQIMNDLVSNADEYSVMPFNAYYINTIETKTTYEAGAKLDGHLAIQYDELTQASFSAIGSSSSILYVQSGTVTKYFDSAARQIVFRIDEGAIVETGSFSTKLNVKFASVSYPASLVSSEYYLPMSAGYQFVVAGNLTMKHNYKMLPGSKVNVTTSGVLTVADGANLVFYRLNDYDYRTNVSGATSGLGFSAYGYPVNMTRYSFSRATIGSAKLHVDGNVVVNGGLYVTDQLVGANTETDSTLAYRNYTNYDNGYNNLTGTGRIDMSAADQTAPTFYENLNNPQSKEAEITTVAIVPIKGLPAEATDDEPGQYVSLTGVSKGMTNDAGLNVWSADPCAAGHTTEKTETVAATCTTYGTNAYWTCTVCGDHFSDEACTVVITDLEAWLADDTENGGMIAALGHTYGDVVYDWAEDYSTCSAVRTCTVEGCTEETEGHTETAEATITSEVTKAATCKEAGERTYTAAFADDKSWAEQQTKTEVIAVDENGHDWDTATYVWADDGQNCTATRVCKLDNTHKETAEATVNTQIVDATCSTAGSTTYTATFEVAWAEAQDKTETTGKLSHTSGTAVVENEVAATCSKEGSYDSVVYCSGCGAEISRKTETVAKLPHTEVIDAAVAATCTATGLTEGKHCSVCGTVIVAQQEVAKLGHTSVTDAAVEATCTKTGLTEGSHCATCGEVIKAQEEIPALGHDMKETAAAVAPTCEATGSTAVYTCANGCGKTEGGDVVAALGHKYELTSVDFSADGTTYTVTVTCPVCDNGVEGHSKTSESQNSIKGATTDGDCKTESTTIYSATGKFEDVNYDKSITIMGDFGDHNYGEWAQTTDPTCIAAGEKTKICSICNDKQTEPVAKLDHSYIGEIKSNGNGKDATHSFKCVNGCNEYGAAVAHSWNDGVVTTEPKCGTAGVKTFTCTADGCGATYTEEVAALSHKDDNKDHICDNGCGVYQGTHADSKTDEDHVCDYGCGVVLEECSDVITDKDHNCDICGKENVSEHEYTTKVTEPTCTEDGYTTYTCNCGHSYVDNKVAAKGHSYGEVTYTGDGKTEYKAERECVCGDTQTATATIETKVTKEATCTEVGETTYTASFNVDWAQKKVTTEAIAKLNHTFDQQKYDGTNHWNECTCGAKDDVDEHSYTSEVTTEATCTTDGVRTYTCVCGYTYTEAIEATSHTYGTLTWEWTGNDEDGYSAATATFDCFNCDDVQSVTDSEIAEVITDATYEAAGSKVYTASVMFEGEPYTDTKTVVIPQLTGYPVAMVNRTTSAAPATIKVGDTVVGSTAILGADGKFTVTCAKACVAIVAIDNGDGTKTYTKLNAVATNEIDTYLFTVTDVTGDVEVIIAIKADANGDGQFTSSDVADLLTNVANNGKIFDEVKTLLFDQILASAAADLLTAIANNKNLEW